MAKEDWIEAAEKSPRMAPFFVAVAHGALVKEMPAPEHPGLFWYCAVCAELVASEDDDGALRPRRGAPGHLAPLGWKNSGPWTLAAPIERALARQREKRTSQGELQYD